MVWLILGFGWITTLFTPIHKKSLGLLFRTITLSIDSTNLDVQVFPRPYVYQKFKQA